MAVYLHLIQHRMAKRSRSLSLANFTANVDVFAVLDQLRQCKSTRRMTEHFRPEHWQLLQRIFLASDAQIFKAVDDDRALFLSMAQEGLFVRDNNIFGTAFRSIC